jgi:hypothetical protein
MVRDDAGRARTLEPQRRAARAPGGPGAPPWASDLVWVLWPDRDYDPEASAGLVDGDRRDR